MSFRFTSALMFVLLATAPIAHAKIVQAIQTIFIIDGKAVEAVLEPRDASQQAAYANGQHYLGQLQGEPGSWLRVSRIDGQWQGLISVGGQLHVLEPTPSDSRNSSRNKISQNRVAHALAQENLPFSCGLDDVLHAAPQTVQQAIRTTTASFDQLCDHAIDGTCAVVELELVFDQQFVQAYPSNYREQGASLLNIVEGFYQQSFGIGFDTLKVTYLNTNVFAETASSNAFLSELATKKASNALSFVENPRAIMHVVRGTPFTDEGTAGIAWLEGLCSDQGYASGTSVLYRPTSISSPSIPITALITTHEIGHNLGAQHDNSPGVACDNGYLMDAIVNPWASEFSSCSQTAIKSHLGDLSSWPACTDFPIKLSVRGADDNVLAVDTPTTLTHQLNIDYTQGSRTPSQASVTLSLEGATATQVMLDGNACRANTDGSQWHCSFFRRSTSTLSFTLTPSWARATITASANLGNNSDFYNVADGSGVYQYDVTGPGPNTPATLRASVSSTQVELSWEDTSLDETGFEIQRRINGGLWQTVTNLTSDSERYTDSISTGSNYEYRVLAQGQSLSSAPSNVVTVNGSQAENATTSGGGGGGGGGSLGWLGLAAMATLLARLRLNDLPNPTAPTTPGKNHHR